MGSHGQPRLPTDPLGETSDVDPAEQASELPPASQGRIRAGETVGGSNANRPPVQRRQETPVRIVQPPKQKLRTHVIQPGDNFSLLAQRYYGNQEYVGFLLAANHNVDPRRMKVGSTVRIPPLPTNNADAARSQPGFRKTGERLHEVREGESLFAIAEDHLGSGVRWREVYELNKARIGHDPAALRVGLILKLPAS